MRYTIKDSSGKIINEGTTKANLTKFITRQQGKDSTCMTGYYLLELSYPSAEKLYFSLYKISSSWWEVAAYFDKINSHPSSLDYLPLLSLPGVKKFLQGKVMPSELEQVFRQSQQNEVQVRNQSLSLSASSSMASSPEERWPDFFYDAKGALLVNPRIFPDGHNENYTEADMAYAKRHDGYDKNRMPFVPNIPLKQAIQLYRENWNKYKFETRQEYEAWLQEFYSEDNLLIDDTTLDSLKGQSSSLFVDTSHLNRYYPLKISLEECKKQNKNILVPNTAKPFIPENKAFDSALLAFETLPHRYAQYKLAEFYRKPFIAVPKELIIGFEPKARIRTKANSPQSSSSIEPERDFDFNCLLLGEPGVGKSSLLQDFATVGDDCRASTQTFAGNKTRLKVYDGVELERFVLEKTLLDTSPRGYLCCFDITNRDSFLSVKSWVDQVKRYDDNPVILIVATKIDRKQDISVTTNEFYHFCRGIGSTGVYTSAMADLNVDLAFLLMIANLLLKSGLSFYIPEPKPETISEWASFFWQKALLAFEEPAQGASPSV